MSPSQDEANITTQRDQLQTEVDALQREVNSLKDQLDRVQSSERSVQRELLEAEDKLIDLNKRLTRTKSDLIDSNDLVTELQEQVRVTETQQRRSTHSLENERFARQQAEGEAKRLAEQLENLQTSSRSEIAQSQLEVQRLTVELTETQQRAQLDLDRLKTATGEELNKRVRDFEEQLRALNETLEAERGGLRSELESQKSEEVHELERSFAERLREATEEFEERIEEIEREHRQSLAEAQLREEELDTELAQLRRSIEANDEQARRSVSELNEYRVSRSQLERDLESLQVRFDQEVQRQLDLQQELEDQRRLSIDERADAERSQEELKEQGKANELALEEAHQEIARLTEQLAARGQTIEDRDQLLREEAARFTSLTETLTTEREGFKTARVELDQLREDFAALQTQHQASQEDLQLKIEVLEEREAAFSVIEEEREKQNVRLVDLEEDLRQRDEQFDSLTNEKANIEAELADLRTQFSSQSQAMQNFEEERTELEELLGETMTQRDQAREFLSAAQDEIADQLTQLGELKTAISQITARLDEANELRRSETEGLQHKITEHEEAIRRRDESLAALHEELSFERSRASTLDEGLQRARQRATREIGMEREGRERLNQQVVQLNAQVSQFAQLSQKVGQSLEIAQLFLEHMQEVEFESVPIPVTEHKKSVDSSLQFALDDDHSQTTSSIEPQAEKHEPQVRQASSVIPIHFEQMSEAPSEEIDAPSGQPSPHPAVDLDDGNLDDEDLDISISAVASVPPNDESPIENQGLEAELEVVMAEAHHLSEQSHVEIDFDDEEDADETNSPGAVLSGPPRELNAEPQTRRPQTVISDERSSTEG